MPFKLAGPQTYPQRLVRPVFLALALGAVAVPILLAGNLRPVADKEAGVAGKLVISLRNDLYNELLGDEFATGDAGAVEPVSFIQLKDNAARVGSIC